MLGADLVANLAARTWLAQWCTTPCPSSPFLSLPLATASETSTAIPFARMMVDASVDGCCFPLFNEKRSITSSSPGALHSLQSPVQFLLN